MHLYLKSAKVVDLNSPYNGKTISIFIEDGIIKEINPKTVPAGTQIIEEDGLHVSPGFFDMQVNFRDPGHEYKEDLTSGSKAAAAGGFTGVAVMPGTCPPLHTKADIQYIRNKTAGNLVDVLPVGAVTNNLEGKELAEMFDMKHAGAVAFSENKKSIEDAGLLLRAMLYSKDFGGLIMTHCNEESISRGGKMHEGAVSASLGLKGMPPIAEEIMIARNLYLCRYADTPIHIQSISTEHSVELIRIAKKKGLKVTCSVNAYNLALSDLALIDFDTNCKVNPPLRSKKDIEALRKGLADGTIDAITSDHLPEDEENKRVEFDYAAFGMIGLEVAFALANMHSSLKLPELINVLAINPRRILRLPVPHINEKERANLTVFLPNQEWEFDASVSRSKSKNSPFTGTKMKGKIVAVLNNAKVELFPL